MGKLPSSFRKKNRTTRQFRDQFASLPDWLQDLTRAACVLFNGDPNHPKFRSHVLADTKTGQHVPRSISISITMQYRAIYVVDDGINVWYWIGTHAQYDRYTGRT